MIIKAKKSLGQNFLVDKNIIEKISSSLNINSQFNLIEIGPGYGSLTNSLIKKKPAQILVIEKDSNMAEFLNKKFNNQIKIINDDILKIPIQKYIKPKTIIFGNLPYNISTKILTNFIKFINKENLIKYFVFMFQKEVADRIIAKENSKNYGRLSVLVDWKLNVKKVFDINPECFRPKPKVKSSLLIFEPKKKYFELKKVKTLEHITNIFFHRRRKIIKNPMKILFKNYLDVSEELNLDLNLRPQNLDTDTYLKICYCYEQNYLNNLST